MTEDQQQEAIRIGNLNETLLNDETFKNAFKNTEKRIIAAWTTADTTEQRESLFYQYQALKLVRLSLVEPVVIRNQVQQDIDSANQQDGDW
jgi:hypothetical protein